MDLINMSVRLSGRVKFIPVHNAKFGFAKNSGIWWLDH